MVKIKKKIPPLLVTSNLKALNNDYAALSNMLWHTFFYRINHNSRTYFEVIDEFRKTTNSCTCPCLSSFRGGVYHDIQNIHRTTGIDRKAGLSISTIHLPNNIGPKTKGGKGIIFTVGPRCQRFDVSI